MSFAAANAKLIEVVDGALDAGLPERPKLEPIPRNPKPCTDDVTGPTSEVSPSYDYVFEYTVLPDPENFVATVTDFWEQQGFKVDNRDDSEAYRRFAVSDDGFNLSLQANEGLNQVSIGGSGPCVEPPNDPRGRR